MLTASRFSRSAIALVPLLVIAAACGEQRLTAPNSDVAFVSSTASLAAPTLWSAAGPGTVTLNNNGSTGDPSMTYALHGSAGYSTQTWSFSTVAATAGAKVENYDYRGFHAYFNVRLFLRPYVISGAVKTYLPGAISAGPANCCSSPSGGFALVGSTTFNVGAGDTYGYEFGGSHFDSDARLLGTFKIVLPEAPADVTPPAIASNVTGSLGDNGWYTSNVNISWSVSDAESPITSPACGSTDVTSDTPSATATCSATSGGGTSNASVTVKRDATAPSVVFSGNAGSYSVDQTVSISCSATDAMSGIATSNCPGASGPAYTFGIGSTSLSASATDEAGNGTSASASFSVTVSSGSLCALVNQWVSQKGIANSMCQQLKNGAYGAFRNHVSAQSGKSVSAANAAILIALSNSL